MAFTWEQFQVHVILTHWGGVTHICVGKLTIIGSDNGLSPDRRQAIIWTNAGLLLIEPLGTNFSEILIKILTFSFKKMRSKVSSAKRRPSCLGLNGFICNMCLEITPEITTTSPKCQLVYMLHVSKVLWLWLWLCLFVFFSQGVIYLMCYIFILFFQVSIQITWILSSCVVGSRKIFTNLVKLFIKTNYNKKIKNYHLFNT